MRPRFAALHRRRRFSSLPPIYDGLWSNRSFQELGLHPELRQALAARDILRPTVVQAESFAPLAKGQDVVLRAETGSGKTLAYLLPLVNRIYHLHERAKKAREDPEAANPLQRLRPWVVLAPTSDLCAQVLAMLEALDARRLVAPQSLQRLFRWEALRAAEAGFKEPLRGERTTGLGEGERYAVASPRIKWGAVDVVVATPAKFCEALQQIREDEMYPGCVVMDEADALFQGTNRLDLFEIFGVLRPRVRVRRPEEPRRKLPELLPTQFVFAAATMLHIGPFSPGNMLIERFCTAQTVETQRFHRLPVGIELERVRWLPGSEDWDRRVESLLQLLRNTAAERTVVFVNTLHNCHVLLKLLRDGGWPVAGFMKGPMGRMGPRFRDAAKFASGEASVLVATEFGGRGIDWAEVDHVVNFQMPSSAVLWLHRVGRTGRMGRQGLVTSFVAEKDRELAALIRGRLEGGKDLHGAFSRHRSLSRRLKARRSEEQPAAPAAEEGSYRLSGGLQLFQEGLEQPEGSEATLIGYLDSAREDAEPGVAGRRMRERAREAAEEPVEEGDTLSELRRQFLASDSESEGEEEEQGLERRPAAAARRLQQEFAWDEIGEVEEAIVAPPSKKQLLNRSERQQDRPYEDMRKFLEKGGPPRHKGGRGRRIKPPDLQEESQAARRRNYAMPDDELLL